jgi:hypothetical protein
MTPRISPHCPFFKDKVEFQRIELAAPVTSAQKKWHREKTRRGAI